MTPEDLATVRRTWTELRRRRTRFVERLRTTLGEDTDGSTAGERAERLVAAAETLLDVLATPSDLAGRARDLAVAWPPTVPLPRRSVDGVAWRRAAAQVCRSWSQGDDDAWRCAWVLLDDILAEEAWARSLGH